jgi:hypothetical protein
MRAFLTGDWVVRGQDKFRIVNTLDYLGSWAKYPILTRFSRVFTVAYEER